VNALSHGQALRTRLELFVGPLGVATRRLFDRPDQPAVVPAMLLLCHQVMRAAVPLMTTTLARARELADPVCVPLAAYLHEHIQEERDHDEWLLEDLAHAGLSRAAILSRIPSPRTAALVGAQYYWVQHEHPVSILGYLMVLEGRPLPPAAIDEMQERSGLPAAVFRTLREHARLDPAHAGELDQLLDALPLTRAHTALLGLSLIHTVSSFAGCIEDLLLPVG
jgi:Iron-containing redox enzyme